MENHPFQEENSLLKAIFNCYFDITRGYFYVCLHGSDFPYMIPVHGGGRLHLTGVVALEVSIGVLPPSAPVRRKAAQVVLIQSESLWANFRNQL